MIQKSWFTADSGKHRENESIIFLRTVIFHNVCRSVNGAAASHDLSLPAVFQIRLGATIAAAQNAL
jgi:hypothetical protein